MTVLPRHIFRSIALAALVLLCTGSSALAATATATTTGAFNWNRNVTFAMRGEVPLQLDVARRTNVTGVRPLVVIVHGGGWWSGTRTDNAGSNLVQQRFATAGFVAASIDYRLACGNGTDAAPERVAYKTRYHLASPLCGAYVPDQVTDIHDAVRFLRANAKSYGADPNRIALVGISAGGHLSLLAAAKASYASRVQGVANWSGATFVDDVAKQDPTKRGTIIASLTNAIGCTIFKCYGTWKANDPLRALRTAKWPFATFNASSRFERIVNPRSLAAYDKAMAAKRWRHEFRMVEGVCHGTGCATLPTSGDQRTLTTATARFFMQSLASPVLPKPKPAKPAKK